MEPQKPKSDFEQRVERAERLLCIRRYYVQRYGMDDPRTQRVIARIGRLLEKLNLIESPE